MRLSKRHTCIAISTTGLDSQSDRIVEIAFVKWRGRSAIYNHSYFDPGRSVSDEAYHRHRLGAKFLKGYDPLGEEDAKAIVEVIGDSILVAFKAEFVLEFLNSELNRHGVFLPRSLLSVSLQPVFSELFGVDRVSMYQVAQELGMQGYEDAVAVKKDLKLDHLPAFGSAAVNARRVAVLSRFVKIKGNQVTLRPEHSSEEQKSVSFGMVIILAACVALIGFLAT
ncbi:MAG: 3'-5' exonuclease [Rhodospirillaceae bacterium]|nr:3'-5' exonuclease [Rhodospirillaceae bacterium]MDE0616561.1 3'-5' exonuclease [Rhodospirillaceae bacterium]